MNLAVQAFFTDSTAIQTLRRSTPPIASPEPASLLAWW